MKTEAVVKKAGSTALKFGAATLGLAAGSFAGNKIAGMVPTSLPGIIQKLVPGVVLMGGAVLIAQNFKDDNAEAAAMGVGLAGFASLAKAFLPASVTSYIPLSGVAGFGEVQSIPPSLVLNGAAPDPNPQNYLMAATSMAV